MRRNLTPKIDWRLYLVTDRSLAGDRDLVTVVKQAVHGGVSVVQLREKTGDTRDYISLARRISEVLKPTDVPLIINDRIDVALAVDADGVHLGRMDMEYPDARRIMGPDKIIGLTVESLDDVKAAEDLDVDYLGVSAIFSTPTKTDTLKEWGIEGLAEVRRLSRHRLIAIGGLNRENAAEVIAAGADGIAVVSAVCAARDPDRSASELRKIITEATYEREKT